MPAEHGPSLLRAYLFLHLIVFIWGFTAVLGKLITLSAAVLVWYRLAIAVAAIALYLRTRGRTLRVDLAGAGKLAAVGAIVALHWVCFFQSIKLSTISVALVTLSSHTLFTSLFEPLVYRRRLRLEEVACGLFVIFGVYLIFQFESRYLEGILCGLGAAVTSAVFTVFNGRLVRRYDATLVGFHELLWGFLALTAYLSIALPTIEGPALPSPADALWLTILGVVCTAFAFIGSVEVMRVLTPFAVSLSVNLEPVYGIVLGLIVFGEAERMSGAFYVGTAIILGTIMVNAAISRRRPSCTPMAMSGM